MGFLGWLSNRTSHFLFIGRKAWGSYGWREKDIFWPSQLRRSLNPSSVEGFFLSLRTIGLAYGGDLYSEGILGLSYADVIAMLFGLVFFLLDLGFCLFCLSFCFLGLIFKPLGFFQLFPKGCQLLLGSSQLVIGLVPEFPLVLGLSLCTLQSRISTFSSMLLLDQFFLQLCIALFNNGECLYS